MNCHQLRRFVDALPLRERSDDDLAEMQEHAGACPACRAYLQRAERLEADLSVPTPTSTDADFLAGVMGRIEAEASRVEASMPDVGEITRRALPTLAAAAIGAVVVAAGLRLWLGPIAINPNGLASHTVAMVGGGLHGCIEMLNLSRVASLPGELAGGLAEMFGSGSAVVRVVAARVDAGSLSPQSLVSNVSWAVPEGFMLVAVVSGIAALGAAFWCYDERHRLAERIRGRW